MRFVAVLAVLSWTAAANAQTLVGTESQVTSAAADQFDPAIAGDIVVYTDFSGVDADVWYTDLATKLAHPVTTAPGDQQLTGVSDRRVVFTDWNTMDVMVYDVVTGLTTNVTQGAGSNSLDPAISGPLVAWTDDRDGNAEIYARDVVTGEERRITNDPLVDQSPAVGGSIIVWERCDGYACDVLAYDWETTQSRQLTSTPWASERFPDVDGRTVVFQREQGTPIDKDLVAIDLDSGTETVLSLPGDQENPHVSGHLVAFNDSASGVPHIGLWDLATGNRYPVTASSSGQYLNDIDGHRIVYSDNRAGTLDIWMYEFQLVQPPVANAGLDQSVYLGDIATLAGTAEDPQGQPIASWQWAIVSPTGDGSRLSGADEQVASFVPAATGDYMLSLEVAAAYGKGDATIHVDSAPSFVTVHVADWLPPQAVAIADGTQGSAPLTVCFDASASHSPQPGDLAFAWDFGDGGTSAVDTPCHVFAASAAPYLVTVTVTDLHGLTDTETFSIRSELTNHPPVASPTASPTSGPAPLAVSFTAGASDPDGDALTFRWRFGDPGSADDTSTLRDPSHVYSSAGAHTAWLEVSDGALTTSRSLTIVVSPAGDLSVCLATIKWFKNALTGKAFLWADFSAPLPNPDDLVMISLDGNRLVAKPFSAFRLEKATGAYVLRPSGGSLVRLNFETHRLLVFTPDKIVLDKVDNANGVDLELMLGGSVAVQNLAMTSVGKDFLVYRRGGCDADPDPERD